MKAQRITILGIILLLTALLSSSMFAQDLKNLKKRIAVVEFEDKARYGYNVGRGVSDMLVTALVQSGEFIVIEREQLDAVLAEQGLGMTGAVTQQSAAQVGNLLGVEIIVTGSVTEFGEKKSSFGGSKLGKIGGKLSKSEARSVVDIRLVNVTTGEIMAAETAEGEESSRSLSAGRIGDLDFHNPTTWDKTQIGKAARKSIDECVKIISNNTKSLAWQGKIIKADEDGTVYMKPGSEGGVQPGMEFTVYSRGEALIDPDTGISLGTEEQKVGKIKVVSDIGDGKAAKALTVSGSGFKAGDLIRAK